MFGETMKTLFPILMIMFGSIFTGMQIQKDFFGDDSTSWKATAAECGKTLEKATTLILACRQIWGLK